VSDVDLFLSEQRRVDVVRALTRCRDDEAEMAAVRRRYDITEMAVDEAVPVFISERLQ
jgi:hypothetical protein